MDPHSKYYMYELVINIYKCTYILSIFILFIFRDFDKVFLGMKLRLHCVKRPKFGIVDKGFNYGRDIYSPRKS